MKKCWSLLIHHPGCAKPARPMQLHGAVLMFAAAMLCLGAVGLGRLTYFTSAYVIAKVGVYQEKNENRILANKLIFLKRFEKLESKKVADLVAYEDGMRLQYGLNSISLDVRKAGVGGEPAPEDLVMESFKDPKILLADSIRHDVILLLRQVELQATTLSHMALQVKRQHEVWSERPSIWPVRGQVTSPFGYRLDPIAGYLSFHEGLDIANSMWTPVFATADGVVRLAGLYMDYGNAVIIDHPLSGFKTLYAHLVRPAVTEGQFVHRGEVIGYMGSSGKSTGTHLHYSVWHLQSLANPADYILPDNTLVD
jgi:murein DD-endopeptidase MepM/ murein hydrolase activator NlpD